jgi:hypothetical protein
MEYQTCPGCGNGDYESFKDTYETKPVIGNLKYQEDHREYMSC